MPDVFPNKKGKGNQPDQDLSLYISERTWVSTTGLEIHGPQKRVLNVWDMPSPRWALEEFRQN